MIQGNETIKTNNKLIILIVKKGLGTKVVSAAKKAGAGGGTIVLGKGTASRNIYENILGIDFEPEKEVVFIIVDENAEKDVLNAVSKVVNLDKPGKGIGFILDLKKCAGIAHLLQIL